MDKDFIESIKGHLESSERFNNELAFQILSGMDPFPEELKQYLTGTADKLLLCLEHGFLEVLQDLEELELAGQDFSEKPEVLQNIENLFGLEKLDLSSNFLTSLPFRLSRLQNLKSLNLAQNRFGNLPDAIESLTSLEYLNIGKNGFHRFPDNFEALTQLKGLAINDNFLKEIPTEIANLTQLEELNVSTNQIRTSNMNTK